MSFRELRDFTEYMRVLGYPRLVSVDNFRTPNFGLVADVLYWMVHRYDPTVSISDDISTEDCRVEFLTSVAHVMWSKSGVKLNTKKLYSADGKAVKELLKVANLLYAAHRTNIEKASQEEGKDEEDMEMDPNYSNIQSKLPDVKTTRKLASAITESGAKLFDLLNEERDISAERLRSLRFLDSISNNLESTSEHKLVEQKLRELLESGREHVLAMEKQCEDLASDEKTLQVKIKKKQGELERNDKRLKSLQSVRPAFMDEYEKLEAELARQYEIFTEKFRNLDYLEHRLDAFNRREREKLEETERTRKRIQMNVLEKKARDLRGDEDEHLFADDGEDSEVDQDDEEAETPVEKDKRGRPGSNERGGAAPIGRTAKKVANEESDASEESESELSEESSLSGTLSDDDDDEDLLDDDDGDGNEEEQSLSDGSDVDDGIRSPSDGSEDSDDNF